MLAVGGSHDSFAVVLCRRHEGLRAIVLLDLREAVEHAAPLVAREGLGVVLRAENAITCDFGDSVHLSHRCRVHSKSGSTGRTVPTEGRKPGGRELEHLGRRRTA